MCETKFAINDYDDRTVSCTKIQWDKHIVSRHLIMDNNVDAVKDTIKDPDIVLRSEQNDNREELYKSSQKQSYNKERFSTAVVVEYKRGKKNPNMTVGEVVTAFPAETRRINKGGSRDVLYSKTSN